MNKNLVKNILSRFYYIMLFLSNSNFLSINIIEVSGE